MKNKWRRGFLLLLGIDLLVVIIILGLLLSPSSQKMNSLEKGQNGEFVSFRIRSNKQDLNRLINHYLQKETAGSPIAYQVLLGNEVELYGTIPFFSEQLNLKMSFIPKALANGDLVLQQKSIKIGNLNLPESYVLKFIDENYKLPRGVDLQPENKLVYVHMQQLKLKSDLKIKTEKFDLKKDDISFIILVPVD
ncbi:YpmS family protein [Bacillus xiapuensis]|uniref:YpmS family protein n=1 Tax=Bacillus xiapuensis TaxID=2014075 RepID=A0ABU6NC80_9BACI|nr:YpmS family protein [Bacillus xiapuensis]